MGLYDQVEVEKAIIFKEHNRSCAVTQHPIDVSEGDAVGRDVPTLASPASGSAAGKTMFGLLFWLNIDRILQYM